MLDDDEVRIRGNMFVLGVCFGLINIKDYVRSVFVASLRYNPLN